MDIAVEKFTRKYGAQRAVDNITFRVNTGEVLGFLGPNGAGKTTTMKAITTFLAPTSGDIKVGPYSVKENPDEVRRLTGYLPETNPLYPEMPVIDYLKFVARIYGIPSSKIPEKIYEMIEVCGLMAEKHKKIGQLSKGYKQRVGLAQAMIHDPAVLILDEPTSGLDPNQIVEIRELIKRIGREKTVILSSHILAEVEATCDRILIINRGRIVADGSSTDLRKRAQGKEVLHACIEDADPNLAFEALKELTTVELVDIVQGKENYFSIQSYADRSSRREVFQLCRDKNWFLTELTPLETKLEDVFRELTMN
jgi:ABC-2 type transport system ATP-binding protein